VADLFETFFRDYALAFDASDSESIASYPALPCTFVNGTFSVSFDSPESIRRNTEEILRHHKAEGYHRATVSDFEVVKQGDNLASVSVRWRVYKSDDSILWEWSNSYNLVDYGHGWKILVSTIHAVA
jgi:ketosteroid isomerase-like protein